MDGTRQVLHLEQTDAGRVVEPLQHLDLATDRALQGLRGQL